MKQKRTNSVRGLYDKKTAPHSTAYLRHDEKRIFKRLVYTPPDLSPGFTCKVHLSNIKNPAWFFILASLLDRGMQPVNFLPPRTIVCFINLYLGAVQLSIVSPKEWLERLWINLTKLRWWATGFRLCLGRICFPGLIFCDRTWMLFLGVQIRLLTRCKICFTLGLSNYFSLKSLSLGLKVTWMCPKVNWFVDYKFIVWFKLWIYERELRF